MCNQKEKLNGDVDEMGDESIEALIDYWAIILMSEGHTDWYHNHRHRQALRTYLGYLPLHKNEANSFFVAFV